MKRFHSVINLAPLRLIVWSTLLLIRSSFGQPSVAGPDQPMDARIRTEIIQELVRQLNAHYVFANVAVQIQQAIQTRLAAGDFDQLASSKAFADTLTAQMHRISHDKHLRLFYRNKPVQSSGDEPKADELAAREQYGKRINFGFGTPALLAGNIGYLRIDEFMPVELAAQTATAAMSYLSQTDVLILDLRNNRGGEPTMVAYLASYFFSPDSVHLNDMVSRGGRSVQAFWTHRQITGNRYGSKPLYILTSRKTFSAGEEFAYDLQQLKRATLVGEHTAGGAHAGEQVRIGAYFTAFIPTEYALNPITHTNWEGTGVLPTLPTTEKQALKSAHLAALETLISNTAEPGKRSELIKLTYQLTAVD